jgi:Ala-tRNA(Pro) deacylase
MSAYLDLKQLLGKEKISYKEMDHEPVFTSAQAAKIRGTNESDGAKALVLMADKNPVMLVLPGNRKINFRKFKKLMKVRDLKMATPKEVIEVTKVPIGAVHPWGSLFGLKTFVDPKLGENGTIVFNAGVHDKSIQLSWEDYLRLEKAEQVSFIDD